MSFSWYRYITETGSELSSANLFPHVRQSKETTVGKGDVLEANHCLGMSDSLSENFWWPAEVAVNSGPVIYFKWCLPSSCKLQSSSDYAEDNRDTFGFWINSKSSSFQCIRQISSNHIWTIPSCLSHIIARDDIVDEWVSSLCKKRVHSCFFQQHIFKYEIVQVGGYVECTHELDPTCIWPAKVLFNIGGRLRLQWFGSNPNVKATNESGCFILFYLDYRIHPIGWGKNNGLRYIPPHGFHPVRHISNIDSFVRGVRPAIPVNYQSVLSVRGQNTPFHQFKVGWKVEAVNPAQPFQTGPATIVKVFNSQYFLVKLDDLRSSTDFNTDTPATDSNSFVSHAGSARIMPVNTSSNRGIHLCPPPGWPETRTFTWTNYLTHLSTSSSNTFLTSNGHHDPTSLQSTFPSVDLSLLASPVETNGLTDSPFCPSLALFRGYRPNSVGPTNDDEDSETTPRFLLGMKLEMAPPRAYLVASIGDEYPMGLPLCMATVTRVEHPDLLWLLPDLPSHVVLPEFYPLKPIMIDARSTDLFPVGWAESVQHPILPPVGYEKLQLNSAEREDEKADIFKSSSGHAQPELQIFSVSHEPEEMCPRIYFNTKCYLGPYLCRASAEVLPQIFGPGPITRVIHHLLTRLISTAYKPTRVLRIFECDWVSELATAFDNQKIHFERNALSSTISTSHRGRKSHPSAFEQAINSMHQQRRTGMRVVVVKFRCPRKGIKYEAPVEICCKRRALAEFCIQTSLALEACPHLISLEPPSCHLSNCVTCPPKANAPVTISCSHPHDCPSFCSARLRSRYFDRATAGGKRRWVKTMDYSQSQEVDVPSTSNSTTRLRTRSAVTHNNIVNGLSLPKPVRTRLPCGPRRRGAPLRGKRTITSGNTCAPLRAPPILQNQIGVSVQSNGTDVNNPPWAETRSLIPPNCDIANPVGHHFPGGNVVEAAVTQMANHHPASPDFVDYCFDVPQVILTSNPMFWTPNELGVYLSTTDCSEMWQWLEAEAVDGPAFMLLSLPILHRIVGLRWGDAVKLSRHVLSVKRAFIEQFST